MDLSTRNHTFADKDAEMIYLGLNELLAAIKDLKEVIVATERSVSGRLDDIEALLPSDEADGRG